MVAACTRFIVCVFAHPYSYEHLGLFGFTLLLSALVYIAGCQFGLLYKAEFKPNRTPRGSFKDETKDGREIKPDSKVSAGSIVYFTAAAKDGFEVCSWKITGGTKISGGNVGEKKTQR